ncbi:MAG: TolC family protein [Cyanobacteria bacterium SZAS LIN-3]|nr:TolC family protein [Cyanobacteria bacterium SZAS LIN-3]
MRKIAGNQILHSADSIFLAALVIIVGSFADPEQAVWAADPVTSKQSPSKSVASSSVPVRPDDDKAASPPLHLVKLGTNVSENSISFESFIQSVDKNYPKLLGADAERQVAGAKRLEKAGAFDPVLSSVNEYLRVQDIVNPGKAKQAIHNESRVDLLSRSGIRVFTQFRLNPNDTKTPLLPSGRSGEYSAGFTVPLMRGLGINEKSAAEQQAKLGEPLAKQIFSGSRLEVLLKAAATYFDWVGAKARVDIANNLLKLAEARVDQIKLRVQNGDSPALDVTESEQEIMRRQASYVKAQRDYQKAALQLSIFFWDENGNPRALPPISDVPPLAPEPSKMSEAAWNEGRKQAAERRPELKKIDLERQQAKIELRLAQNMILPAMDAYFAQGADTGLQGIGSVMRGGMTISAPLRQRTARGQVQAAQLKLRKLSLDEKAERLRIQTEVDDIVSAINTSVERFDATALEVKKAKVVEAGERLRFAAGDSTLFLVNQRERTTAEAQMRLVETHVDYMQALAAFKVVTCNL